MNAHRVDPAAVFCRCVGRAACFALLIAGLGGAPGQADTVGIFDPAMFSTTDGRQIYEQICQGCHMADARGAAGAGVFPALAQDRALASRQYMALTILMGRRNMPAFGARHAMRVFGPPVTLSEQQIAAVINYVRTHFGNRYRDPITAAEVKALDQGAH
jgi:mono/diheme cytochrome c family protein